MARQFPNVGFPRFPRSATDILLVRHGESEAAVEGRLFPSRDGHGDPGLTPRGRTQAERLAERLGDAHVHAVYVSTLRRTHETAAPLATLLGLEAVEVPDLREVHLGEWEGGVYRQMAADAHPAFVDHLVSGSWDPIPGGEGDVAFRTRVNDALLAVARRHAGQQIAVVTHGGVIGAVVAEATGSERTMATIVDQTSITRVVVVEDRLILRSLNDTTHLGDHVQAQVWPDEAD
ncbi:MAG: histidine phosphatase family protein [Acidimicrobiia bacterium]|nr:histidine phosphatase family protein [Acidimicrobiia bacterium]